jgi:hypothetical protein
MDLSSCDPEKVWGWNYTTSDDKGINHCTIYTASFTDKAASWDPILYPTEGPFPTQGKYHAFVMYATNCNPYGGPLDCEAPCQCQVNAINFLARAQGTRIFIDGGDNQTGAANQLCGIKGYGQDICVFVGFDPSMRDSSQSGETVTFSVEAADASTIPEGFSNARLSHRHTMYTPPYEYPFRFPFLGDDPEDGDTALEVQTDEWGDACARFYYGNTGNFQYKIKAKIQQGDSVGDSVVFTVTSANAQPGPDGAGDAR